MTQPVFLSGLVPSAGVFCDQGQQSRKTGIDVITPQSRCTGIAPVDLTDQTGFPQNTEMVCQRGLAHRKSKRGAGALSAGCGLRQLPDDAAPEWVGKGGQNRSQFQFVLIRMPFPISHVFSPQQLQGTPCVIP